MNTGVKVQKITSAEINRTYVRSMNYRHVTEDSHSVAPVDPVEKVHVDSGTIPAFTSDTIFGHLEEFQEILREMDAHRHRSHDDDSQEIEYLIGRMNLLIQSFNHTMTGLKQFDHAYHTDHSARIATVLHLFKLPMESVGIEPHSDNTLSLDPVIFKIALSDNLRCYEFLFDYGGPFPRILAILRDVKIPKLLKKDASDHSSDFEKHIVDTKG